LDFPFPLLSCTIREKIFFRKKRKEKAGGRLADPPAGRNRKSSARGGSAGFPFPARKRPDVFQPFRKNPAAGKPARLAALGRLPGLFRLPAGNIRFLRRSLPVEKGISRSGLFRPSECGVLPLA